MGGRCRVRWWWIAGGDRARWEMAIVANATERVSMRAGCGSRKKIPTSDSPIIFGGPTGNIAKIRPIFGGQ
jgi:hypothetical protein